MAEQTIRDILEDAPSNWDKWGDDDEIGALNYLTEEEVLRGIQAVKHGKTFYTGYAGGPRGGRPRRNQVTIASRDP